MKRWLTHLAIVAYLGTLFCGVAAHAVGYKVGAHPGMYFIVWDMFCGWSSYESRNIIVGQGESGNFYQLAPPPWGEYHPYASLGRHHYDAFGNHAVDIARNTLAHTQHEPMVRLYVVEESWSKKFNLPEHLWNKRFDEPKDFHAYYHVRSIWTPEGAAIERNMAWISWQETMCVTDNPRLRMESKRGQPFYAINPGNRVNAEVPSIGVTDQPWATPVGVPLGN